MQASLRTDKDNLRHENIFVRRVPCDHLTQSFCKAAITRQSSHYRPCETSVRTGSVCWMTITGQSSHYRPCEASLMDRHWNIPMADYEWQAMNAEPRSRDHSPWTVYRSGLFTAHVPRPGIRRCNCSLAGQGFAHRAVIVLRSRIRRCDALPRAYGKLPQVWGKYHLESCSHW